MATFPAQRTDPPAQEHALFDITDSAIVERLYCDGCERMTPAPDCWHWERYTFCPRCQEEYITAWAMGRRLSPGQYVRDKRFGEEEAYALSG